MEAPVLKGPILISVFEPDTINEPVIITLPVTTCEPENVFEPVVTLPPPPEPNPASAADAEINVGSI